MWEVECKTCGAVYRLTQIHIGMRDKDNIRCRYCGTVIKSWNGADIYEEEELHGPTKKYKKAQN